MPGRPAGPVGIRPGTGGPAARRAHHAAAAAAGALPVLPPDRVLLPSWCAPRRADGIEVIGAAAGLAMAGHGHRPVAAALGVPAGTVRGWLRRLRARAGRLRAHAIGELNGLGFYPPGPPSQPAGSPLGDALNAVAAAVDCARRNFGHGPEMTWPLVVPARPGPLPHARPRQLTIVRRSRAPPCPRPRRRRYRGELFPAPRHHDQISATMTTNPPPDARNARIYVATANVAVMDILSGREQGPGRCGARRVLAHYLGLGVTWGRE